MKTKCSGFRFFIDIVQGHRNIFKLKENHALGTDYETLLASTKYN